MAELDKAVLSQMENIKKKTGKTLPELEGLIKQSGASKHGDIRQMLMDTLGLGHGDANTLTHFIRKTDGTSAALDKTLEEVLAEIYSGPKSSQRPIYEALMTGIQQFGPFDIIPKKGYISLKRKKQFAMLGPKTNTRFELGINGLGLPEDPRLQVQAKGCMCTYIVSLTDADEVDSTIISWVRHAYELAGGV